MAKGPGSPKAQKGKAKSPSTPKKVQGKVQMSKNKSKVTVKIAQEDKGTRTSDNYSVCSENSQTCERPGYFCPYLDNSTPCLDIEESTSSPPRTSGKKQTKGKAQKPGAKKASPSPGKKSPGAAKSKKKGKASPSTPKKSKFMQSQCTQMSLCFAQGTQTQCLTKNQSCNTENRSSGSAPCSSSGDPKPCQIPQPAKSPPCPAVVSTVRCASVSPPRCQPSPCEIMSGSEYMTGPCNNTPEIPTPRSNWIQSPSDNKQVVIKRCSLEARTSNGDERTCVSQYGKKLMDKSCRPKLPPCMFDSDCRTPTPSCSVTPVRCQPAPKPLCCEPAPDSVCSEPIPKPTIVYEEKKRNSNTEPPKVVEKEYVEVIRDEPKVEVILPPVPVEEILEIPVLPLIEQLVEEIKPPSLTVEVPSVAIQVELKPPTTTIDEPIVEVRTTSVERKPVEPDIESVEPKRESVEPKRESVEPKRESVEPKRESIEPKRESIKIEPEKVQPAPPPRPSCECYIPCCCSLPRFPLTRPQCFETCTFPFSDVTSRAYRDTCCPRIGRYCRYESSPCKCGRYKGGGNCYYPSTGVGTGYTSCKPMPITKRWKYQCDQD